MIGGFEDRGPNQQLQFGHGVSIDRGLPLEPTHYLLEFGLLREEELLGDFFFFELLAHSERVRWIRLSAYCSVSWQKRW